MQRPRAIFFLIALMIPALAMAQIQTAAPPDSSPDTPKGCAARSLLLNFDDYRDPDQVREVPIWRSGENSAFFFVSGMAIDADGAPNAYNANNTGLDDLVNAGRPGHWDGVLQDQDGNPLIQGPDDPFPGFYISCTSLSDWTKLPHDPTRFVDASKIPYVVLPGDLARQAGARLGDFAAVFNLRSGRFSFAIFADVGTLGEGSMALADNLGIWSDARRGGARGGVLYLVFPGSGDHQPKSIEAIDAQASAALKDWGGVEQVRSCATDAAPNFHGPLRVATIEGSDAPTD
jgi:hypothetical protein